MSPKLLHYVVTCRDFYVSGRRGWQHCILGLFFCPFIFAHLVNTILWKRMDRCCYPNWHTWSTGQEHQTVNFDGQEVKYQGHTRPKYVKKSPFG